MAESGSSVQSLDRALDILEALSQAPQGMTLSALSAAVGLHISTTHRLVSALAARGYTAKDVLSGKYRLTLRLFAVGSRVSSMLQILEAAQPLLDEFAGATGEAVHLVQREGDEVTYLYKAEPFISTVRMSSCVGMRNPMYCTGVGKSILALLPEQEVRAIWSRTDPVPYTPATIVTLPALERELALVRRQGYALDREEHEPGVCCAAVAIRDDSGRPVAAVSISAPPERLTEPVLQSVLPRLEAIAGQISALLGAVDTVTQNA